MLSASASIERTSVPLTMNEDVDGLAVTDAPLSEQLEGVPRDHLLREDIATPCVDELLHGIPSDRDSSPSRRETDNDFEGSYDSDTSYPLPHDSGGKSSPAVHVPPPEPTTVTLEPEKRVLSFTELHLLSLLTASDYSPRNAPASAPIASVPATPIGSNATTVGSPMGPVDSEARFGKRVATAPSSYARIKHTPGVAPSVLGPHPLEASSTPPQKARGAVKSKPEASDISSILDGFAVLDMWDDGAVFGDPSGVVDGHESLAGGSHTVAATISAARPVTSEAMASSGGWPGRRPVQSPARAGTAVGASRRPPPGLGGVAPLPRSRAADIRPFTGDPAAFTAAYALLPHSPEGMVSAPEGAAAAAAAAATIDAVSTSVARRPQTGDPLAVSHRPHGPVPRLVSRAVPAPVLQGLVGGVKVEKHTLSNVIGSPDPSADRPPRPLSTGYNGAQSITLRPMTTGVGARAGQGRLLGYGLPGRNQQAAPRIISTSDALTPPSGWFDSESAQPGEPLPGSSSEAHP